MPDSRNSVYSLFSALIMHVYQMRSSVPSVVSASQERINVCMNALKEVSKVWLVAKMVHTLFESILGNKVLEERLQKATGRKAQRSTKQNHNVHNTQAVNISSNGMGHGVVPPPPPIPTSTNSTKRKFDDIDLGFSVCTPAPQMSYERSRPQTPAVTPSRDVGQQQNHNTSTMLNSPPMPHDQFLPSARSRGASRVHSRGPTRANSPFNGYSIPATPPDLFLVTRNSPNISQQLWENFQPDQLFPDGTIGDGIGFSSPILTQSVDPQLQMSSQNMTAQGLGSLDVTSQNQAWPQGMQGLVGTGVEMHESDGWSNSSVGNAPIAPTTLNVEDWFQFFGINGDNGGISIDQG